jgi:hypothetical protein
MRTSRGASHTAGGGCPRAENRRSAPLDPCRDGWDHAQVTPTSNSSSRLAWSLGGLTLAILPWVLTFLILGATR